MHTEATQAGAEAAGSVRRRPRGVAGIEDLASFDDIIDVRSPAEFAEDHVPGALSCPVLDDVQRAEVGTLYKQVSPFAARRIGAAYASQNIARHLQERFLDKEKGWRPLIMCWRGGQRSSSMVTVFRAIGWDACQLEGGYKVFRHHVLARLEALPAPFRFRVLSGATGSAKTRILQALAGLGGQVLDLEGLACHKGSVLGLMPEQPQPGQKWFETQIWQALEGFDPARPIFIEAESRKIGNLRLPEQVFEGMRQGVVHEIRAERAARVAFLLGDYAYFRRDPGLLKAQLGNLRSLLGQEIIAGWHARIDAGDFPGLTDALLEQHYDPLYARSQERNYAGRPHHLHAAGALDAADIHRLAGEILAAGT